MQTIIIQQKYVLRDFPVGIDDNQAFEMNSLNRALKLNQTTRHFDSQRLLNLGFGETNTFDCLIFNIIIHVLPTKANLYTIKLIC